MVVVGSQEASVHLEVSVFLVLEVSLVVELPLSLKDQNPFLLEVGKALLLVEE
tara:strand:- start:127 stop:285 length:159 start_codon:yes stop_codon:yes gene_type:complete